MEKNFDLSGMIHSKFSSEAACARHLGWPKQKLNRIVNGKSIPTLLEANALADCLDVSLLKIANFYLPTKSTNV